MKNKYLVMVTLFCFLGSGCMEAFRNKPLATLPDTVENNRIKIPLDVAVFYPKNEKFSKRIITMTKYDEIARWLYGGEVVELEKIKVGRSSKELFKKGLQKLFRSVTELYKNPGVLVGSGYDFYGDYDLYFVPEILVSKTKGTSVIEYKLVGFFSTKKIIWNGIGKVISPVNLLSNAKISNAQTAAFENLANNIFNDQPFLAYAQEINDRKSRPSDLLLTTSYHDKSSILPNNMLDAAEEAELVATIENRRKGPAFEVNLELMSDNKKIKLLSRKGLGTIQPGKTEEIRIPISAPLKITDGGASITISAKERRGYDSNYKQIFADTLRL